MLGSRALGFALRFTGMPPGPFPVGVTTLQLDDPNRVDKSSRKRRAIQTEVWYPAQQSASNPNPINKYSDFFTQKNHPPDAIEAAEKPDAIGGYRDGLTIAELDKTWPNEALRDAQPSECHTPGGWPLVVFSHGSGAFRASYIYFTEFLASHGYVVMACDHPGSARYTQVDGEVITPGGARSTREQMEADRPADVLLMIDSMEKMSAGADPRFAGRVNVNNCAVTGMSFGGFTAAAVLEKQDPRIKAAILHCASLKMSGNGFLAEDDRSNKKTPVMVMLGSEDTVIGEGGNEACRRYFQRHLGPRALVEILKGGHVSFTSCELYNPQYGNGIGTSASLSNPGEKYEPLPIEKQHHIINSYSLAFLDAYLRPAVTNSVVGMGIDYLRNNHFEEDIHYHFHDA